MTRPRATAAALALLIAVLGVAGALWALRTHGPVDPETGVRIRLQLEGAREVVHLVETGTGHAFIIDGPQGPERLTPEELAQRLYLQERDRDWLAVLLNISSPMGIAWVALGLGGQLLFAGRMLVQWIHSERERRSVVPPVFWWLSLMGSIMLLVYFLWRTDIVGILGQGLGFVIYARNLMLIRSARSGAVNVSAA